MEVHHSNSNKDNDYVSDNDNKNKIADERTSYDSGKKHFLLPPFSTQNMLSLV